MKSGRTSALAALIASALAGSAVAQTVVDGDTIKLDGTTWRLWGMHAHDCEKAWEWRVGHGR